MSERLSGYPGLIHSDYDDTIMMTSEPAPNGVNVDVGYANGLEEIVGPAAAEAYWEQGGHKGRSPAEIVRDTAPHLSADKVNLVTPRVVNVKIETLESAVGLPLADGTPWPRISDGFTELWGLVDEAKAAGEPIATAVISNGHTAFEVRTFDMAGLSQPNIYVTHDVLEGLRLQLPINEIVKPNPFMVALARQAWKLIQTTRHPETATMPLTEVYAGDHLVKDKGMATNAGVPFALITPESSRLGWQYVANRMGLGMLPVKESVVRG